LRIVKLYNNILETSVTLKKLNLITDNYNVFIFLFNTSRENDKFVGINSNLFLTIKIFSHRLLINFK